MLNARIRETCETRLLMKARQEKYWNNLVHSPSQPTKGEILTLTFMIAFPQFELQFIRASNLVPKVRGRVGRDYGDEVECSVVTVLYVFLTESVERA